MKNKIIIIFILMVALMLSCTIEAQTFDYSNNSRMKVVNDKFQSFDTSASDHWLYGDNTQNFIKEFLGYDDEDPDLLIHNQVHKAHTDNQLGQWYEIAKMHEVVQEIKYRLREGNNDEEDLKFYKALLTYNSNPVRINYTPKEQDLLYTFGVIGSPNGDAKVQTLYSKLIADASSFNSCFEEGNCRNEGFTLEDDRTDWALNRVMITAKEQLDAVTTKIDELENSEQEQEEAPPPEINVGSQYDDDWWGAAQNFFNENQTGTEIYDGGGIIAELDEIIFDIGNMIFIIVTSLLGVKYIFGAAEGKAQVKDSLITLIVAALFFYGWSAIDKMLDIGGLLASGTLDSTASKLYNTVLFIVNLLAISGVIWIGVKYMLSSAEGKSEIKTSWGPLILGIVMVYATVWFLSTIVEVILQ